MELIILRKRPPLKPMRTQTCPWGVDLWGWTFGGGPLGVSSRICFAICFLLLWLHIHEFKALPPSVQHGHASAIIKQLLSRGRNHLGVTAELCSSVEINVLTNRLNSLLMSLLVLWLHKHLSAGDLKYYCST
jgi:hypothetical protein